MPLTMKGSLNLNYGSGCFEFLGAAALRTKPVKRGA